MSSYLMIYGVPRRRPDDESDPKPVLLLSYSRNTRLYQVICDEIHPAYGFGNITGNDDDDKVQYTQLTHENIGNAIESLQRECLSDSETLNRWYERLFHALRGRRVVLDDDEGKVEYNFGAVGSGLRPEDSTVDLQNRGFGIINEWISTYTQCLSDDKEVLEQLYMLQSLIWDSTSQPDDDGPYSCFEKIVCNIG